MKKMRQTIGVVLASALVCSACSDIEQLTGNIPLSGEKIVYLPSLHDGFLAANKTRAVPTFSGIAKEQKVLPILGNTSKQLYLHPLEVEATTANTASAYSATTITRGAIVTGTSWSDDFGVSAVYTKDNASQSFFQNLEAAKKNGKWSTGTTQLWPTEGSLSFYAYAPYQDASLTLQGSDEVEKDKTIHYSVPATLDSQPDFIVAKSENNNCTSSSGESAVQLHFSHALTAITFSVSDDLVPGKVKSITVKGVSGYGDYNLSTESWGALATVGSDYTIKLGVNGEGVEVNAGEAKSLTDATSALMMIPQALSNNAQIEMTFNDGNQDRVVSANLNGTVWQAGKHITYVLSASSITTLQLGDISFPTSWSSHYTSAAHPLKSDYANGDKMGLYVVDENKKVIAANVELNYDGTAWALASGGKYKFSPKYNYFVYYPYHSTLTGLPAENSMASDVSSASGFFASAISNWSDNLSTDQETLDKMNACDLQVGMGSLDETGTKVKFSDMIHAMGLADITLGKKVVGQDYYLKDYEEYTWFNGNIYHANSNITGHSPLQVNDYQYVAIVKPEATTTFSSAATGAEEWDGSLSLAPKTNSIAAGIAKCKQEPVNPAKEYTLALGDVYYSDGALSHQSDELIENKTPIGVVAYLGDNYWTETQLKSSHKGGHALVMCLKTAGSKATADLGTNCCWYNTFADAGLTKLNTGSLVQNSYSQLCGSGYTDTKTLVAINSNYAAADIANNYSELAAPSKNNSGWFLPSAGQWYAMFTALGGLSSNYVMGFGTPYNMGRSVGDAVNEVLKKVGEDNYTEFARQSRTMVVWASSEYDRTIAICVYCDGGNIVDISYAYKNASATVRPFLAF